MKFGELRNLILQTKSNLSVEVKKELKNKYFIIVKFLKETNLPIEIKIKFKINILANFLNEEDKLLKPSNQILGIPNLIP